MIEILEAFRSLNSKQYYSGVWHTPQIVVDKDGDETFFVALPKGVGFSRDVMKASGTMVGGHEVDPQAFRAAVYLKSGARQVLKIISDYDLLISLLGLYGKDDNAMISGLADLCRQYGLIGTYEWNAKAVILLPREDSLTRDMIYFGFTLTEAKQYIALIYGIYLCWQYLDYGELEVIDFLTKKRGRPYNFETIDKGIEKELQEALLSFGYRRDIKITDGRVKHISYCDTLIGVAMLQLIELIGSDANTSRTVAWCDNCHKQFYKTHGSMTLCSKCRTGAAKAKRHRNKVKMDKLNRMNEERQNGQ